MLPPYLPIRLLHKIVFIGESVDMFEDNENINTKSELCLSSHKIVYEDLKSFFMITIWVLEIPCSIFAIITLRVYYATSGQIGSKTKRECN